ncbi:MAG: hypothetical protein AAF940_00615 [Pseudomonadota bacterium]
MKKTAVSAALLAAAMVITPAAAKDTSRLIDRDQKVSTVLVHHKKRGHVARHYHILPRHIIVRSLYRKGYRNVKVVGFNKGHYRVRANGYRGRVALRVNARNGAVVHRRLIRPYYSHPRKPGIHLHWRLY